jgi:predicted AlkP superfamily pyrophosphatase or phosphodiesterase
VSSTTGDAPAPLILVSLDGFRDGYARRYDAPALDRMARTGTKADYLKLAFPTKTFPNHYTLVTGQYPARHGIISNNIYDPAFDASFSLGNTEAIRNARWWGAEPIWVTAEKQGLTAATYFWPGSEAAIGGVRPTYWRRYDGSVPGAERVDQVLQWLDRPPSERPDLVTLYFSAVDGAGHAEGPRSPAVAEAVTAVDGYLERLYDGLRARGQAEKVNVIVTSDHGMAPLSRERVIFLDDYLTGTGGRPKGAARRASRAGRVPQKRGARLASLLRQPPHPADHRDRVGGLVHQHARLLCRT